jgi:hypothetical protein
MNGRKSQPGIARRLQHAARGVERETFSLVDVMANLRRTARELERLAQEILAVPEAAQQRSTRKQSSK